MSNIDEQISAHVDELVDDVKVLLSGNEIRQLVMGARGRVAKDPRAQLRRVFVGLLPSDFDLDMETYGSGGAAYFRVSP